jgi:hypothetical protein
VEEVSRAQGRGIDQTQPRCHRNISNLHVVHLQARWTQLLEGSHVIWMTPEGSETRGRNCRLAMILLL